MIIELSFAGVSTPPLFQADARRVSSIRHLGGRMSPANRVTPEKSKSITRRKVLSGAGMAALGAAILPRVAEGSQNGQGQSPKTGTGYTGKMEMQDQAQSGHTQYQSGKDPGKHEPLEDFKFDLEATTGWVGEAGSAKE